MLESGVVLSPAKYYEEAKRMLEEKDLVGFISNISKAELLATNDSEMIAETLYFKVQGLYSFNCHKKALECIPDATYYNTGLKVLRLKNYQGVMYGFLGELDKAKKNFTELIEEIQEIEFLAEVVLNLVWVYLDLEKDSIKKNLEIVKSYLDIAENHFDVLPNELKWRFRNNSSIYYFYKNDYDKAIEILEDSIQYCSERDLPDVYNNLAELYLKISEKECSDVLEIVIEYLDKAELIGSKYENNLALGYIFYTKAMIEYRGEQLYRALDTLHLALEYFRDAEATIPVCEILLKINEMMDKSKQDNLKSLMMKDFNN